MILMISFVVVELLECLFAALGLGALTRPTANVLCVSCWESAAETPRRRDGALQDDRKWHQSEEAATKKGRDEKKKKKKHARREENTTFRFRDRSSYSDLLIIITHKFDTSNSMWFTHWLAKVTFEIFIGIFNFSVHLRCCSRSNSRRRLWTL